jgi:hypothetical protein
MTPAISYQTALRTDCKPFGKPRYKFPLPQESLVQFQAYAFDQEFEMVLSGFPPAPKNTPSNAAGGATFGLGDANAILTAYTQPATTGAGMGKFNATFSRVPASWDDFKTLAFTFPGFPGYYGQTNARDIFTDKVTTRLHYDYFLVDPTGLAAGVLDSGGNAITIVVSASLIPTIAKGYFYVFDSSAGIPYPTTRTNSIVPIGGITVNQTLWFETIPNLPQYLIWIANALANGWSSTVWNGTSRVGGTDGQIVADDCWLQPYAGNIWERITPYILAK